MNDGFFIFQKRLEGLNEVELVHERVEEVKRYHLQSGEQDKLIETSKNYRFV